MSEVATKPEPKVPLIKWIEPQHFGPFSVPQRLKLDPRVTVLTGANDTGKSALLRAIRLILTGKMLDEQDVNGERIGAFSGRWQDDSDVGCLSCFSVTTRTKQTNEMEGGIEVGDGVVFYSRLTHNGHNFKVRHIERNGGQVSTGVRFQHPPQVVCLPLDTQVKELVNLGQLTDAEERLLKLGFGPAFNLQQHEALTIGRRVGRVSDAQHRLNDRLRELLPPNLPLEFRLHEGTKPAELSIALVDPLRNHVPIGSRGAGIRHLLNLMGALLVLTEPSSPTIILLDEPENSLHADAQHALRRLLERLAESPLIQVVYATHSPSMVNTMRPSSIRVLERQLIDGKPCSAIVNEVFADNFFRVRSSLGLTPSDSLLYAPVTVVVEGPSEVRALPVLLERLHREKVAGFEQVEDVLSQVHFLDGTGDQYEYMVRLAKSQNAKPILMLDGDKTISVKKVREKHPEVAIVLLPEGEEFENIVPAATYIGAVAATYPETPGITHDAFQQWQEKATLKPSIMFSKRVQRWLEDEFDIEPKKPLVMEHAVRATNLDDVKLDAIRELFEQMSAALRD